MTKRRLPPKLAGAPRWEGRQLRLDFAAPTPAPPAAEAPAAEVVEAGEGPAGDHEEG